jgi:CheY-like chemotaxis protein
MNAWAGHRALVVDDSDMNRSMLSRVLRSLGFVCETAENGAVALTMVNAQQHAGPGASSPPLLQPFTLITLDRNMPALGGEDTARALRAGPRPFTGLILGITGDADAPALHRFAAAGVDAVLVKPVSKARVAEALAAHGPHT